MGISDLCRVAVTEQPEVDSVVPPTSKATLAQLSEESPFRLPRHDVEVTLSGGEVLCVNDVILTVPKGCRSENRRGVASLPLYLALG